MIFVKHLLDKSRQRILDNTLSNNDLITFCLEQLYLKNYIRVAIIDIASDDISEILKFSHTLLHNNHDWQRDNNIILLSIGLCRNLSIGDVIDVHGEIFIFSRDGFLPLNQLLQNYAITHCLSLF